jgi:hypothetical protein
LGADLPCGGNQPNFADSSFLSHNQVFFMMLGEPFAKPQKGGAKLMGQDVYMGCKISNVAASAASTIVHCQLSIVHFSGFAIGSGNKDERY